MCTWRARGLSWQARWTSTAASTGNQSCPGGFLCPGMIWRSALGTLVFIWIGKLFPFWGRSWSQAGDYALRFHPQCGIGLLLCGQLENVVSSWKAVCYALCVVLATLAQIPMEPPQSWAVQGAQCSCLKCWVEHRGAQERGKTLSQLPSQHTVQKLGIINVWWSSGEK